MASSPYFARMAIPLFLEKFATLTGPSMVCSVVSAERVCLHCLSQLISCVYIYRRIYSYR